MRTAWHSLRLMLGEASGPMFFGLVLMLALAQTVSAREVTDATGRTIAVPDAPARVFAAGPPASALLYALKPEAMLGWSDAPNSRAKDFLLTSTHELPELGRLAGRGGTVNLEALLARNPDLIVDLGTVSPAYVDFARRITEQTDIPYVLIDGSFDAMPAAIRVMAELLAVSERGELLASYAENVLTRVDRLLTRVPPDARPRVYLARGPAGLETPARGSINAEIVERVGAINVVDARSRGMVTPSLEQIIAWAPDTILTIDRAFAAEVSGRRGWQAVPAVAEGRVFRAPAEPFGFIDAPPSVNRLIGLTWLLHMFYPDRVDGDLRDEVRTFMRLFWQVEPDEPELDYLLND